MDAELAPGHAVAKPPTTELHSMPLRNRTVCRRWVFAADRGIESRPSVCTVPAPPLTVAWNCGTLPALKEVP